MAMTPILLIGFSGNAFEIFEAVAATHHVVAFLDDDPGLAGREFGGVPVLPMARLDTFPNARVLCMIGSQKTFRRRGEIIARLGLSADRFATFVHPRACVSRHATLGVGTVIYPGTVVTAGASVGDHVLVLHNTVVHHDSRIGDRCLIGSGVTIAGNCRIGPDCYVGSASSVKNGVTIGAGAVVGMASNVLRDVAADTVVAANPARPIQPSG